MTKGCNPVRAQILVQVVILTLLNQVDCQECNSAFEANWSNSSSSNSRKLVKFDGWWVQQVLSVEMDTVEILRTIRSDLSATVPHPKPEIRNPQSRNPKPETRTRNPKPETRNPKPETRNPNPKPETQNPKPETRNPTPENRNPKPETRNPNPLRFTAPSSLL